MAQRDSKRIVVLVLASDDGGYDRMVEAVRATWARKPPREVTVLYCYGHRKGHEVRKDTYLEADCLYSDVPESRSNLFEKTMRSFRWILDHLEFDYIFRCNCGSYVDLPNLVNFIQDKPSSRFYCGITHVEKSDSLVGALTLGLKEIVKGVIRSSHPLGASVGRSISLLSQWNTERRLPVPIRPGFFRSGLEMNFASGSGFFISKDLVEMLCSSRSEIPYVIMDDVAIGAYLTVFRGLAINKKGVERFDTDEAASLSRVDTRKCYHLYFKHSKNPDLMYLTHEEFTRSRRP